MYLCPLCQQPLLLTAKQYQCTNRHSFDIAREGYVNLLPVQHKNSKDPGDNKEMMQARRAFFTGWLVCATGTGSLRYHCKTSAGHAA